MPKGIPNKKVQVAEVVQPSEPVEIKLIVEEVPTSPEKVEEVIPKADTVNEPEPKEETVNISKQAWEDVQKQLKMLYEVADKGRVMNYESNRIEKKPFKVQLSVYNGGIITAWQTNKDEIVRHPVTGLPVGETQEIEVKLLMPDNSTVTKTFNSYVSFSGARYDSRIECVVMGKSEDYQGKILLDLQLPDGRRINLSPSFVN